MPTTKRSRKNNLVVQYAIPRTGIPRAAALRAYAGNVPGVTIRIVGEREGRRLNSKFRKKQKATNVLSFPYGKGSGDIVLNWKTQEAFFKKFKQLDPSYPVKFALFNTGSHGTPIRMTDWRLVLNWMLEVNGS